MKKLERKDFILLGGGVVAGGATGFLFSGAPFRALQWITEWTQDQYVPPKGHEISVKSVCKACSNKCNITVRMIEERAVKVETSNEGCPAAQLALQMLYHPERIRQPMKRIGGKGSGDFVTVTWDEAIRDISSKIETYRRKNKSEQIVAIVGGDANISSMLIEKLIYSLGSPNLFFEDSLYSLSNSVVELTQKINGSIYYDFENADYVLSFGARLLEGWGEPSRIHKALAKWKSKDLKFVHIDTLCTRTASMADKWLPVKPGTEAVLALGIAYHLIKMGKNSKGSNFANWSQIILNEYTPKNVSKITGIKETDIKKIAIELASAKRPIAIAGRGGMEVSSSIVEMAAVQSLNSILKNFGKKGGVFVKTAQKPGKAPGTPAMAKGIDDLINNSDNIGVLLISDANPVHQSVYGNLLSQKMKKIPLTISFSPLINDTARYSDYILPTLSVLEMATIIGNEPVPPKHGSMHAGDIILKTAKNTKDIANLFPWNNYKDLIKPSKKSELKGASDFIFPVDLFTKNNAEIMNKTKESSEYPLVLLPFQLPLVGDGRGLAFPYVLKGIDGKVLSGKYLWVQMNPETADKYGVSEGSSIDIISKRGEIGSVKVHLTKTVAPGVVAIPLGFGHVEYTKYAEKKGVNPKKIMSDSVDPISGLADWWYTRIKIG